MKLWKEKILSVVGEHGKLLTELIPELERVIGVQPQIRDKWSSVTEAENRFNRVFQQFVRLFCRFVLLCFSLNQFSHFME